MLCPGESERQDAPRSSAQSRDGRRIGDAGPSAVQPLPYDHAQLDAGLRIGDIHQRDAELPGDEATLGS